MPRNGRSGICLKILRGCGPLVVALWCLSIVWVHLWSIKHWVVLEMLRQSALENRTALQLWARAYSYWRRVNREPRGWQRRGLLQEGPEKRVQPWIGGKKKRITASCGGGYTVKCKTSIQYLHPSNFQCFNSQCAIHGLRPLEVTNKTIMKRNPWESCNIVCKVL